MWKDCETVSDYCYAPNFIRKPDDKSRWFELFGTPERAARTLYESTSECRCCVIRDDCGYDLDKCVMYDRDKLLEWLRGDAE